MLDVLTEESKALGFISSRSNNPMYQQSILRFHLFLHFVVLIWKYWPPLNQFHSHMRHSRRDSNYKCTCRWTPFFFTSAFNKRLFAVCTFRFAHAHSHYVDRRVIKSIIWTKALGHVMKKKKNARVISHLKADPSRIVNDWASFSLIRLLERASFSRRRINSY